MSQEKIAAPSGMAGIVTYYEEEKSLVKIKPFHVFVVIAVISEIELFFQGLYQLFAIFFVIFAASGYWIMKMNKNKMQKF